LGSRHWRWFKVFPLGTSVIECAFVPGHPKASGWPVCVVRSLFQSMHSGTRHDHLLLCTEEVVRCVWDKHRQWGGKDEMNARRTTLTSLHISDLSPLSKNEPAHIPRSTSLSSDLYCCRQIRGAVVKSMALSSNSRRC